MKRTMILLVPFVGGAVAVFFLRGVYWLWPVFVFFAGTAATAGAFQMAWRAIFGVPGGSGADRKSPDRIWEKTNFQLDYQSVIEPTETAYDGVVALQYKILVGSGVLAGLCGAALLVRLLMTKG